MRNYKKKNRYWGESTIIFKINIQNLPLEKCDCMWQECKGKYLKTRENQTMCIYSMKYLEILDKYSRLKVKSQINPKYKSQQRKLTFAKTW
jgi:hypothetical protein